MHVVVGSRNPVKVSAVETALAAFDPAVSTVAVESGVAEQPRSVAETIEGAENRARRAYDSSRTELGGRLTGRRSNRRDTTTESTGRPETVTDGDEAVYGVGIEGGVADLPAPGTYLIMWAAVTDGDRIERGAGPSLRLPDDVAARLAKGEELGSVLDDRLGIIGVARREGAAGVFTDGLTNRRDALAQAVACAFGPFRTDFYA